MRRHGKNSPLEPASWDEALDTIVQRFQALQAEHGRDCVSVFSGSSTTNEKCYIMGKFACVALGTRHCDYNGRLCMSSATGASERSLGIDRAANPISDMLHADCILQGRIALVQGQVFIVAIIVIAQLWLVTDALYELLSGRVASLAGPGECAGFRAGPDRRFLAAPPYRRAIKHLLLSGRQDFAIRQ